MTTFRKILIILCALIFFIGLGMWAFFQIYYSSHLPARLDVESGHIYQVTINHGHVVFANFHELGVLNASGRWFNFGGACGMFAGLLNFIYNDFLPKKPIPEFRKSPTEQSPFIKKTIIFAAIAIVISFFVSFFIF